MVVYPINIGIHGLKIHVMQWEQWGLLWTMDPSVEFTAYECYGLLEFTNLKRLALLG